MKKIELAISFGSKSTIIAIKKMGIVLREPTIMMKDGKTELYGSLAQEQLGRATTTSVFVCPIENGVVAQEEVAVKFLKNMLNKVVDNVVPFKKEIFASFSVPVGISAQQKQTLTNVAFAVGISKVDLIYGVVGAKLGYNKTLSNKDTCVVCDIGGGKTDLAIVSGKNVIAGVTLGVGGKIMDIAIMNYIERNYSLKISMQASENLKINIGSLIQKDKSDMEASGVTVVKREPQTQILTASDVNNAVVDFYKEIAGQVSNLLKGVSSDIASDILTNGILLAGGGAKLTGIDGLFKSILSLPISSNSDLELVSLLGILNNS